MKSKKGENMELIPINHTVSKEVEEKFIEAKLYEEAGMTKKAQKLKFNSIVQACRENKISVIRGNRTWDAIYNWQGFDWEVVKISNVIKVNVPMSVLLKMGKIANKGSLYIAVPRKKAVDPVLLYRLPYSDDYHFIELARWE